MIAVDTNLLVRVLTNDDPVQAKRAIALLGAGPVWIAKTVLLETEWVLRYTYDLDALAIGDAFTKLLAVPGIDVEHRAAVELALGWHQGGMDFADALHLASSETAKAFASFDRSMAKAATRAGAKPKVIEP
jgi:predicted nucleic-acid-binding protein